MSLLYRFLKSSWRKLASSQLSQFAFNGRTMPSRIILNLKSALESTASHQELYDRHYFEKQDRDMANSAEVIADSLIEAFPELMQTGRVADVGCGSGSIMYALQKHGVDVEGLEYADAAIQIARGKGLRVEKFDIENEHHCAISAWLVISTEVAEHLPERYADRYVKLLQSMAQEWILITAATPGQGGTDHVNEQPNCYWIQKLSSNGFEYRIELTEKFRREWLAKGADRHRSKNVLVFQKPGY